MGPLSFIYHPDMLLHDTGTGHPEGRQRLESLIGHLMGSDLWGVMDHVRPEEASLDAIVAVHTSEYVESVSRKIRTGERLLDEGDTRVSAGSWRAALLAAGAAVGAVDLACSRERRNAFCAVRPPGHHAETSRAMGFCVINNVAVAARHAQRRHGLERIAIVDWDVHHGNGTEEIFWRDPSVLYVSLHQYPHWPGTGAATDVGEGVGKGTTLNCPMRPGSGEKEYEQAFRGRVVPALTTFAPDLLLISAGFDAHRDDPLANINLTEGSFAFFTRMLVEAIAGSTSCGIVSVLEGGYDLPALSRSVESHLRALVNDE